MTFAASCLYHRGYKIGDVLDIYTKNGIIYKNCVYSHISKRLCNTAMFIYMNKVLGIPRHEISDIIMIKKSPFRKRKLYTK